jgi:Lrp/AsnC family transcriptional regulator, leucine-responsive regulatory protein
MQSTKETIDQSLDAKDLWLLTLLQRDCSLTNQALAQIIHVSSATCLRRVKRLEDLGFIEKRVALLSADRLAQTLGEGLSAIIEVSLDQQSAQRLDAFEALCVADAAVQQCYRTSSGPDFVLIAHVRDMREFQALVARLFTAHANVRNVKTFFSTKRAKFSPVVDLSHY